MKQQCGHPDFISSNYTVTSDLENGETPIGLDSFHILTRCASVPGDITYEYGAIHGLGQQHNNQPHHETVDTYSQVERKRCFVSRNRGVRICKHISFVHADRHFLQSASLLYRDLVESSVCQNDSIWPRYLSYRDLLVTLCLTECVHGIDILGIDLASDSFVFFGILLVYMITIDVSIQNKSIQFYSALDTIRESTYCPLIAHGGWYPLGDVSLMQPDLIGMSMRCLLYTSPSPRDLSTSRMPSSA